MEIGSDLSQDSVQRVQLEAQVQRANNAFFEAQELAEELRDYLKGINFSVDGKPVDFADTVTYRGMMFTGVPNMVWIFGYFRASWTLRVDLIGDFVCRLLNHMDKNDLESVEPVLRPEDQDMPHLPWMDPENFNPGYLMRSMHLMPRRGDKPEWQHTQDYWLEKDEIPKIDLADKIFSYR